MNEGRLEEAISLYREATRYDPLTPSFWTDLGQAMAIKAVVGREEKAAPQAEEYFRWALRLNRFDPNIHSIHGGFLLSIGRYDEGVAELRRAVDLHPFLARRYEYLAEGYVLAARAALLQERKEEARKRLEETLALREEMRRRAEMVPVWAREAFPFQPETPGLLLYWGEALASLGREGEAEPLLRRAAEAQDLEARLRAEALVWLSDLARRKGEAAAADQHLARARELFGESQNMRALPELMRKASAP
jgi:Tfp pilus assembly protein PilF